MPERKLPIHLPVRELGYRSEMVFVTVCSAKRKKILARSDTVALMLHCWQKADRWLIGRYVIMPDHVHFFCAPNGTNPVPLESWVKFWKSMVSRQWPRPREQPIWQSDFWDRQLRTGESYAGKWEYVRHNPVRHQLVERVEDWPYQGELNALEWHDP